MSVNDQHTGNNSAAPPFDLRSASLTELREFVRGLNEPDFRAAQLFAWLQQKGARSYAEMSDLPQALRDKLARQAALTAPAVVERRISARRDTAKLLLEFADGERIEMALLLYDDPHSRERATVCLSTQSGCAMGCKFCATARCADFRNLNAGEIVVQAQYADALARELGFAGVTNVVFMGMGEPLANLDNLRRAIELLNDERGMNIGQRRITVSTCGLVPQIYAMLDWGMQIGLAVSLHSALPEQRAALMPAAARYSPAQLIEACRDYRRRSGRRVTCEYALFAGVNDSVAAADALAALLTGTDILVNIIPANSGGEGGFHASDKQTTAAFAAALAKHGVDVELRRARGQDIEAGCGQLRRRSDGAGR
ncbi:MAG: 23S rRNA (adenine(2503)-C(2))-methyltransferase RlmN [Bacillota bacterium]|nr:23S rRNA (adenine(2503)-C(2))-methyltransferase RlmN [Bacillota bacterium]